MKSNNGLLRISPPPTRPVDAEGDWSRVETVLCALPDDYKSLVKTYGVGCFDGFIWLLSPFSQVEHLNLVHQARLASKAYTELYSEFGEEKLYPIFPEKGGLLPFALTDNGDYVFWKAVGSPEDWKVVVGAAREPRYERFNFCATEFLAGVLSHKLKCEIFPADFPTETPRFISHGRQKGQ
jgi:hypothetical protein